MAVMCGGGGSLGAKGHSVKGGKTDLEWSPPPRVVFGAMFRETGGLPWVLLWRTWCGEKGKGCLTGVKGFTGLMGRLKIFLMAFSSMPPELML